jgi:hypothetical protein
MRLLATVIITASLVSTQAWPAFANCDDPHLSCLDRLEEAAKNLKQSNSFDDVIHNVQETGRAVEQCVNCGMDNVDANMRQMSTDDESNK